MWAKLLQQGIAQTTLHGNLEVLLIRFGDLYSLRILSPFEWNEKLAKLLNVKQPFLGYRLPLTAISRTDSRLRSLDFKRLFGAVGSALPLTQSINELVAQMAGKTIPLRIATKDGLRLMLDYRQLIAETNEAGWRAVESTLIYQYSQLLAVQRNLSLRLISDDARLGAPLNKDEMKVIGNIKNELAAALKKTVRIEP